MLRAFPIENDAMRKWYMPTEIAMLEVENKEILYNIFLFYRESLQKSVAEENYAKADTALSLINIYQRKWGADIIPSDSKIDLEIKYNNWQVFNKLFYFYFTIGLLMLIPLFIDIVTVSKSKILSASHQGHPIFIVHRCCFSFNSTSDSLVYFRPRSME